jgi:hypothetical protein
MELKYQQIMQKWLVWNNKVLVLTLKWDKSNYSQKHSAGVLKSKLIFGRVLNLEAMILHPC